MEAFDDDMKKRAADFRLEPREPVWERIEQELDSKKRRRPLFWLWWLIPIAFAGGGLFYFNQPTAGENEMVQEADKRLPIPSSKTENPEKGSAENAGIKDKNLQPTTHNTHTTTKSNASTGKAIPGNGSLPERQEEIMSEASGIKRNGPGKNVIGTENTDLLYASNSFENGAAETESFVRQEKEMLESLLFEELKTVPADDPDELNMDKYLLVKDSTGSGNTAKQKSGDLNLKKATWNLVVGAGLHNVSSNGIGLFSRSSEYLYVPPQNNTGGGLNNSFNTIQPSEAGPGLVLGIERNQPIGKKNRWEWLAGLHYQFQTIQVSSGPRKDSLITVGDRNNTSSYFNLGGSSMETTGNQHRVHGLTGVKLLIGKQRHWAWQNGIFGGLVLANDYLVPLSTQRGWVPSKGVATKGYLGLETGLQFKPSRWGAGLYGQYNLTSSVCDCGVSNQYWSGFELRVSYQIITK